MKYLGIDTSNYTTSVAVFDGEKLIGKKIMLSSGDALGLRQSEAHFNHTKNLPLLFQNEELKGPYTAVGCSARPRNVDGSYMPCFLAGVASASSAAASSNCRLYEFSHQEGHIAAVIATTGNTDLFEKGKRFFAFHLSGGTTELLSVTSNGCGFDTKIVTEKSDISAGQTVDRVGKILGFDFPSGAEVDKLALMSDGKEKLKCYKNGTFCFSGLENKSLEMKNKGVAAEEIAGYIMRSLATAIADAVEENAKSGTVVMSGGVSSSNFLRNHFEKRGIKAVFSESEYSCDNATGIAVLTALADGREIKL